MSNIMFARKIMFSLYSVRQVFPLIPAPGRVVNNLREAGNGVDYSSPPVAEWGWKEEYLLIVCSGALKEIFLT